jgi:hypothetical protein
MRYERKYREEGLTLGEIQQIVRNHPMSFRRIHPDRQVNNVYFDTEDLHFFRENLYGVPDRHKIRLRWYGGDHLRADHAFVELKCKQALLGEKFVAPAPRFLLRAGARLDTLLREAIQGLWQDDAVQRRAPGLMSLRLVPTLLNTYHRSYHISHNGKFRLTIDRAMHSYGFTACQETHRIPSIDPALVVEVKYDAEYDEEFPPVGQGLPFRLSRNSKYVTGMLQAGNV